MMFSGWVNRHQQQVIDYSSRKTVFSRNSTRENVSG